jgi:hypothetical protein
VTQRCLEARNPHQEILRHLKKVPEPGKFNNMFCRQNGTDQRSLRIGVNFIEMVLGRGPRHELPYAFVESASKY